MKYELLTLAQKVSDLPGLEFRGLMFFPGQFVVGATERADLLDQVNYLLGRTSETFSAPDCPSRR